MLFSNVMKTLILLGLFVAIPLLLYRLFEQVIGQGLTYCRNRLHHLFHKEKVR